MGDENIEIVYAPSSLASDDDFEVYYDDSTALGAVVLEGQEICCLEGTKVCVAFDSPCSGVITRYIAKEGGSVESGSALFEVSPIQTVGETRVAVMRILAERFPQFESKLISITERVSQRQLIRCMPLLGAASMEEIMMALAQDD